MTESLVLPLTTRTRIALAIARGIGASRGDDELTPTHIALGLLREGENPAVAALWHAGVPLPALRRELEAELGAPHRPQPHEAALPSTPGEQRLVDLASAESRLRDDKYLGTEHLLLAMLRDAGTPTAQAFARHGFEFETAVTQLQKVFHGHSGPPGPHASAPAV